MNENINTRATKIQTSAEQQLTNNIVEELQNQQHVNAYFILSKFIDCNQVKNQPQFCEILFHEHLQVVIELIQWMLLPNEVAKKKKLKNNDPNISSFPYQCRQFFKDNWCFYEQMYIAARNKKFQFSNIFNFLRKEHFDKKTIYTALGYFADVFIPFAKYQFSGSFNLTKSFQMQTKDKNIQTLSIMKIFSQALIDELITYCHYQPIFQFLKTSILVSIEDPRDYQLSKLTALKLMKGAKFQNIFAKFPVQSPTANDQLAQAIEYLQNISYIFKEMIQNIQPSNNQFSFRNYACIQAFLDSGIIKYSVQSLITSRLCGVNKQKDRLHSSAQVNGTDLGSSLEVPKQIANLNLSTSVHLSQIVLQNILPSQGSLPFITDADQQDIIQILLRILSSVVQIFIRIPRSLNVPDQITQNDIKDIVQSQSLHKSQQLILIQVKSPLIKQSSSPIKKDNQNKQKANKNGKTKLRQITYSQYLAMTSQFHEQIQYILNNMQIITKFVYNQTQNLTNLSKIIPFASGQNVKVISFMKLEYFKLLHNCLIMIQIKDAENHSPTTPVIAEKDKQKPTLRKMKSITILPFDLRIQKLHPLQIIKKYLVQNKWNNIAHHFLQKICHLLIISSYQYIQKNIQKDQNNKFSDSFLAYLIQNFTKRDFVFLNTVKFTSQGNLHSLYNIAKDLAYTLNSTNQLVAFLNEFEPWKKFIMTDLKNYEEKIFPDAIKPTDYQKNDNEACNIKVDEADSIKKLIENIPKQQKWPTKMKYKNMSKSGLLKFGKVMDDSYRPQKDQQQQHMTISGSKLSRKRKQNNDQFMDLKDILKRKIASTKKGTQVRQFDIEDISVVKNIYGQQKKQVKSQIIQSAKSLDENYSHDIESTGKNTL